MFDIGFGEMMIIGVIGLVVLGPERLPTAIRTVRGWISKVKSFSNNVQTELKEEFRIHELHENLKKAEQANMENLSPELAESVKTLKDAADMVNRPFDTEHHKDDMDYQLHGEDYGHYHDTNDDIAEQTKSVDVKPVDEKPKKLDKGSSPVND